MTTRPRKRGNINVIWRWLLVPPAFLLGAFLPPLILGFLWQAIEGPAYLMVPFAEGLVKAAATGFCAVYFASLAAPAKKSIVGFVSVILGLVMAVWGLADPAYTKDVGSVLGFLGNVVGAGGAAWWVYGQTRKETTRSQNRPLEEPKSPG